MVFREKLHNVEAAFVDIEVDVALLEIGGHRLPDDNLGIHLFDETPGRIAHALAVNIGFYKQKFQLATTEGCVYGDDHATNLFPIQKDAIGLSVVDGLLDGVAGDDLIVFLEVVVTYPKLEGRAILERPLVVEDELILVVRLQRSQGHLWFVAHTR